MAKYRISATANKVIREKKLWGFLWWVTDHAYQDRVWYHEWQMNDAVDKFNKAFAAKKKAESAIEKMIKDVGSASGELTAHGPVFNGVSKLLATTAQRKEMWCPQVGRQDPDWKPFARLNLGSSGGGGTKNLTIEGMAKDLVMDGNPDPFPMPQRNNNNSKKQKGNNNQQHHH